MYSFIISRVYDSGNSKKWSLLPKWSQMGNVLPIEYKDMFPEKNWDFVSEIATAKTWELSRKEK